MMLITFIVAGILFVTAVHGRHRRFALEEALDVLVVVELIVTRQRLRGGLTVVLMMGRDFTEYYAVVLLQQRIA